MPERFSQQDFEKHFSHLRPQILKRAGRIINPLDDHPFVSTSGNQVEIYRLLTTEHVRYPLRFSTGFSKAAGIGDFLTMRMLNKDVVDSHVRDMSERGVHFLQDLLKKYTLISRKVGPIKEVPIFPEDTHPTAVLDLFAARPKFRHILHFIQYSAQVQNDDSVNSPRFSYEDNLAIFAATVGFGQAFFIDEAKLQYDKKRKDTVRDEILIFAKKEYGKKGFQPMMDYIEAQKVVEFFERQGIIPGRKRVKRDVQTKKRN